MGVYFRIGACEVDLAVYNNKKPMIFHDIFVFLEGYVFAGHF
jgi:hypothetical protein